MSVQAKTYLDLAGLTSYNGKIKEWSNSANQVAYKTVIKSTDGNSLYFYKKANAVLGTDTPDATIALGGGDSTAKFDELASKIGASWSGNTLNLTAFAEGISATTLVGAINEVWTDINTFIGTLPDGQTTVTGYIASAATTAENNAKAYTDAEIAELNANVDASGTPQYSGTFVVSGITEANGIITGIDSVEVENAGAAAALEAQLAAIAKSGNSADASYDNTTSGLTATNVKAAIDEVAASSQSGINSKTVWLKDDETVTSGYLKTYGLYQGANSPDAETSPATLIGKIDIPKDLVVTAGKVVTVTNGVDSDGESTSVVDGTYVKLTIANQTEKIYINVHDLVDVYTAAQGATQVQLAISSTNEISATLVAGGVDTTELANSAVTTAKIADDAVTADKIAITAHSEAQTAGADGLAISVTTTDGQVSAVSGSIAANTYDAYGAAANAVAALDGSATIATYTAGVEGAADVITIKGGVSEADGVVANSTADDITLSNITTAQINSLFA